MPLNSGSREPWETLVCGAPSWYSALSDSLSATDPSILKSSLFSCSHHWWKMGCTVQEKCKNVVILAIQCRLGIVHFVQAQDSWHLWAGGQRKRGKSITIVEFKCNHLLIKKKNQETSDLQRRWKIYILETSRHRLKKFQEMEIQYIFLDWKNWCC